MTANDLIPIEAEGFHAFADAFALDDHCTIFLSMAGHKDALKAIRAKLFTNRWLSAGTHDMSLLPRGRYITITRTLPSGTPHMALYLKEDQNNSGAHYTFTLDPKVLEPDLYFSALTKHSAVPVHPQWRTWLYKRALKKQEIETLTCHRAHGAKVYLNDEDLAEDIVKALKKGSLKKNLDSISQPQLLESSAQVYERPETYDG
ncbi:MAG: hypothetical protein ACE5JU_23455 [Candidatus Binatia bacterium]